MNYLNHKDFEFNTVKKALLNADAPFPPEMIDYFSDISEKDLELLKDVWPQVWIERRRGLLEDMENLAENDTLLDFDPVAIMCLEDEDPVARATAIRLLWQSDREDLVPLLLKRLQEDTETIVRAAAATALGTFVELGELEEIKAGTLQQVVDCLIKTYQDSGDKLICRRALESLGYSSHPPFRILFAALTNRTTKNGCNRLCLPWVAPMINVGRTRSWICSLTPIPKSVARQFALRVSWRPRMHAS